MLGVARAPSERERTKIALLKLMIGVEVIMEPGTSWRFKNESGRARRTAGSKRDDEEVIENESA